MKTKRLSIRVTTEEQAALRRKAKQAGVKLSSFVLEMSLTGSVCERRPLTDEERDFYRLLTEHTRFVQAMTNYFYARRDLELQLGLKQMIATFKNYQAKLMNNDR